MNGKRYLQDKRVEILIFMVGMIIEAVFLAACQVGTELFLVAVLVPLVAWLFCLLYDYYRKNSFYRRLFRNLDRMDQKYLVLETLESPRFYDGELLKEALYEANKSMTEHVNESRRVMREFKDFIEMWVHQVKLPVASLLLLCHNHPDENNKKYMEQLRRIDRYTEQVLYYTRAEHSEKDYLIQECSLAGIIHHTAMKNKDDLLENKVEFQVENCDLSVVTDEKWMEFVLDQIVNNSIKYRRKEGARIRITARKDDRQTILSVWDNGIGIASGDLPRLFEKSFTGSNGRIFHHMEAKSTGMGLYIAHNMCEKLGHKIKVESEKGEYTRINITFL